MPEFRTRGVVLRTFDHGESDRLVHLYTESLGRISAIAKGARRSQRRFPGTLEIFSLLDVRVVDPPRSSLMRLEGAVLLERFEGLTRDLARYGIACQLLELLDRFTGEREENRDLFGFAVGVLDVVSHETPDRLLALLVLTKTLARLGFRPQLVRCVACGEDLDLEAVRVSFVPREGGAVCPRCTPAEGAIDVPGRVLAGLEVGIRSPLRERLATRLSAEEVAIADRLLLRFFSFHVGFELRTRTFLRDSRVLGELDEPVARVDTAPAPGGPGGRGAPPSQHRTHTAHEREPAEVRRGADRGNR